MASTHIEIGTSTRLGSELRGLIDQMRTAQNTANKLKGVFDQLAMGEDWVALAGAIGVPGGDVEQAETIYNLLGSVLADDLKGVFYQQFIDRLG